MVQKITDSYLQRLRKYIADETERLGKRGAGVVHHIDLDEVDESGAKCVPMSPVDPLERDVDLLFGSSEKRRRPS
jgi:hypothetical protein